MRFRLNNTRTKRAPIIAIVIEKFAMAGLSPPYEPRHHASGNSSIAITIASSRPMFAG